MEETNINSQLPVTGLTLEQVKEQKALGNTNKTKKKVTKTYFRIILDNVFNFFNIVYFVVAIFMLVANMKLSEYMFMVPVALNTVIGVVCDVRTRKLVDKLRLVTDPKAKAIRNDELVDVDINALVLGDVILLNSGDQVPSDCELIYGELDMDESLLSGESDGVKKKIGDEVLSATYVKSGKAYCKVIRVGSANYAEGLQSSAKSFQRPKSELKTSYFRIFLVTGILALSIGAIMGIMWVAKEGITYEGYKAFIPQAAGSMVAMIPAGLYLLTSISLAVSVGRLAKKNMNVQQLYCVEMLARVDTICFDKTGTITDGNLQVKEVMNRSDMSEEEIGSMISAILLAAGDENGTAKALLARFGTHFREIDEFLPFDSKRKYAAGTFDGKLLAYGAPEFIKGKINAKDEKLMEELMAEGYRVLGVFYGKGKIENEKINGKIELVSIIALSDHIKDDAKDNIKWFTDNDVTVKVISGDNPITVAQIAKEAGVPNADKWISLEGVSNEDVERYANEYSVFGRVNPEQKALLVASMQAKGHKVAMTGDGVNDILALKKADCSIAMASGATAARNVAHIVSVDNDFSKMPDVVAEGRKTINNLQRSASLFLSKTIFAITLSVVFLLWRAFGGSYYYPFTPKNLYVWEIVTIAGGGFFLALEHTNDRVGDSFMVQVLRKSTPAAAVQIMAVIIIYTISELHPDFINSQQALTMSTLIFTSLSYCILFRACLPMTLYRGVVFTGLFVIANVFFVSDSLMIKNIDWYKGIFGLYYSSLTAGNWWLLTGLFVALVGIYVLFDMLSRKLTKKYLKHKEDKAAWKLESTQK